MPTPKIIEYTPAVPPEKTSTVVNVEFVVPSSDAQDTLDALDYFLDNHVRTVGAGQVFNTRTVAHGIKRAMQILDNRREVFK